MPTFHTSDFNVVDTADSSKLIDFDLSGLTSGQAFNRTITAVDNQGYWVLSSSEGSVGQILTSFGGAGTQHQFQNPDFLDDIFRVSDNSDSSKKLALQCSAISSTTTRTWGILNLTGSPVVVGDDAPAVASGALGKVDLTAQTANIVTTDLSNTPPAGVYEVEVYLMCTTADVTAGTLTVTIGWTDNVGATTSTPISAFTLASTGRTTGRQLVRVASGNITYAVAVTGAYGTSQYAVYARVVAYG